jgi:hypothetical protein
MIPHRLYIIARRVRTVGPLRLGAPSRKRANPIQRNALPTDTHLGIPALGEDAILLEGVERWTARS